MTILHADNRVPLPHPQRAVTPDIFIDVSNEELSFLGRKAFENTHTSDTTGLKSSINHSKTQQYTVGRHKN